MEDEGEEGRVEQKSHVLEEQTDSEWKNNVCDPMWFLSTLISLAVKQVLKTAMMTVPYEELTSSVLIEYVGGQGAGRESLQDLRGPKWKIEGHGEQNPLNQEVENLEAGFTEL